MGVLLVAPRKLGLVPPHPGLEVRGADGLVLRGPQVLQQLHVISWHVFLTFIYYESYLRKLLSYVTPGFAVFIVDILLKAPTSKC